MTQQQELTRNQQIAGNILEQLGGSSKLAVMIGAKNFVAIENGLQFKFMGCRKVNTVQIILNGLDLYDVKFYKFTRKYSEKEFEPVTEFSDLYAENMIEQFENTTGLCLNLF